MADTQDVQNVQEDVTLVEEQTTTDSSDGKQTTQQTQDAGGTTANKTVEDSQAIPYPRFREVNEKAKRFEEENARLKAELEAMRQGQQPEMVDPHVEAVKQQLKALGFVSKEEIDAELKRREEEAQIERELARLEQTYNGSDGRPKFDRDQVIRFALERQIGDLEAAYEILYRKELIDWHIQQAIQKSKGIKTEASDGSGSQEAGTTDSDLKEAIARGDKEALRTFLKRLVKTS